MDLQKLKYFYEAARIEHITKAAENLCIAQPALTKAIRSLEDELGVALFTRTGRNIQLTDCGDYLKKRLDTLLPEIDGLPEEINQLKSRVNKTVKLNILAASSFVIDSIIRYRKLHPDVIFDFEQNISETGSDIVIYTDGIQQISEKKYLRRSVKQEEIFLAVPKTSPFAARDSVNLTEVKEESFVMLSSSRLFGVVCNRLCADVGFVPKILFESDSPAAVQNIVSTGTGVAFWPKFSWGKIKNKDVALLPISHPVCRRELILELYDRFPQSEYAADFYDFLIRRCRK